LTGAGGAGSQQYQTMIKILYNNCYGGFNLSKAFKEEYHQRTGKEVSRNATAFWHRGPDSFRCDPIAVAIVDEFGGEWSSGLNSAIEIREIPTAFARYWDITEYDGEESVTVNITDAYADILHGFMDSGDLGVLVKQYRAIKVGEAHLRRNPALVMPDAPAGGLLPAGKSGGDDSEFIRSMKAGEWRAEDLTAIFRAMAGGVKDIGLVDDEEEDDGESDSADSIGHA
jgi:hypothetical protein